MYIAVILFFIMNLQISVMQTSCVRTLNFTPAHNDVQTTTRETSATAKAAAATTTTSINEKRVVRETSFRNENERETFQNESQLMAPLASPQESDRNDLKLNANSDTSLTANDLDSFRLEYNKFKILSYLSMTANPDQLAPELDQDLRHKLRATNAFDWESSEIKSARNKRSLSCNQVKSNKDTCCLETFYVNFTEIGWDKWIIYPAGYNANYCRGQCDLSHARYYHSTLLSKFSNIIGLCCSPKQMAPLRLLYIDEENKVHQKSMPDMIVESCDCA